VELYDQVPEGQKKAKRKYGQFDWAEKYFVNTDLSNITPRDMMQTVIKILGTRIEDFPVKTFYWWYSKYRKARYPKKRKQQKPEVQVIYDKKALSKKKSWMDFEPSVPVPLVNRKESILRPVVDDPEI